MKKEMIVGFVCILFLISCSEKGTPGMTKVVLETNKGDITIQLFENKAPATSSNFKSLVQKGFYDGTIFHRVIKGFVIQGGDPEGTGRGGPGYTIKDEISSDLKHDKPGIVAMASRGPDTAGSQFYIILTPQPLLDGKYSVFGEVVDGMDVVEEIGNVETGSNDKPVEDVVVKKAFVK